MRLHRRRIVLIATLGLSLTAAGFAGAVLAAERRPEPTEPSPDSSDPFEAPVWRDLHALESRDGGR
jgi:hypothetical protein